jgi:hypothetical protein
MAKAGVLHSSVNMLWGILVACSQPEIATNLGCEQARNRILVVMGVPSGGGAEGEAAPPPPPVCWANKAMQSGNIRFTVGQYWLIIKITTTILGSFSGKFFLTTRAQSEKVGQVSFRPPNFFLPVSPCWL